MDGLRSEVYAYKKKCHVSCDRSQRFCHPRYQHCRAHGTTSRSYNSITRRRPAHIPYTPQGKPLSTPPPPPLARKTYATAPATGVVAASKTACPDQSRQSSPPTICVGVSIDERRHQVVHFLWPQIPPRGEGSGFWRCTLFASHTAPLL